MSHIINPDSAGKERTRLSKAIVAAVRELAKQSKPDMESRDLAAFIVLALNVVSGTIESSVAAWEKRSYWVKADKFRMEWVWAGNYSEKMYHALQTNDWGGVANSAAMIAQKLNKVTVPNGNRIGKPWVGAWDELQRQNY